MRNYLCAAALWLFSSLLSVGMAQTPTYADRLMVEMAKAVVIAQPNPKPEHLNALAGLQTWEQVQQQKSAVWEPGGRSAYPRDYRMLELFYGCLGPTADAIQAKKCYEELNKEFQYSTSQVSKIQADFLTTCWKIAQEELDKQPANEVLTEQTIAAPAFPEDKVMNTNAARRYEDEEDTIQGLWTQWAFWVSFFLSIVTSVAIAQMLIRNKFERVKEYIKEKISKVQPIHPSLFGGDFTSDSLKGEVDQLKQALKAEIERNNRLEGKLMAVSKMLDDTHKQKTRRTPQVKSPISEQPSKPDITAKRYYISSPEGNKFNDANKNEHNGSFLLIEQNANKAEYGVNAGSDKFWKLLREGYLSSEYVFDIFQDSCPIDRAQSIARQEHGLLERQGNDWVIVRKVKVCFN